jgi:GT2 family glycosyltransferase
MSQPISSPLLSKNVMTHRDSQPGSEGAQSMTWDDLQHRCAEQELALRELTRMLQRELAITGGESGLLMPHSISELQSIIKEKDEAIVYLQDVNSNKRDELASALEKVNESDSRSDTVNQLKATIQARNEGIAYLRGEVAEKQRRLVRVEKELNKARKQAAKLEKSLLKSTKEFQKAISQMQSTRLWKLRQAFQSFNRFTYAIRHPKKFFSKDTAGDPGASSLVKPEVSARTAELEAFPVPVVSPVLDAYESLQLLPTIPGEALHAVLNLPQTPVKPGSIDIISFSIVDWEFRFQRPQQIMAEFAAQGHRVFYISTSRFLPADAFPRFELRELRSNVFEVSLAAERHPDVYGESIFGDNGDSIMASLAELRRMLKIEQAVSYVSVPSWGSLATETRSRWSWQVLYDCMDEWEDFDAMHPVISESEKKLVPACDLLVVTAQKLYEKWQSYHKPTLLARNGVDYDFYERSYRPNTLLSELARPVIGYYGGIANWFDEELMFHIAQQRPQWTFVLVGGVFGIDMSRIEALPNVRMLGQQPYETMPLYLYHFDVCIIPFKINAITEATDPVKFYEYISWGKPVVSVELPELDQYRSHLYLAADQEDFVRKLDAAVAENDPELVEQRRQLAQQHTWRERVNCIKQSLVEVTPLASIIIVTYNNLSLTRLCLESLLRNTDYPRYEIIVVDNHSLDDTAGFLHFMERSYPHLRVIYNEENRGFAAANNQGLALAKGERLILLNNDTIVPPGWLERLLRHLNETTVGLVGPVTNFVGNEAKVMVDYETWHEMEKFARYHCWQHDGQSAEIHMLAMFCLAMRRDVYEKIGPLDEQFGIGMFEDDDYAMRARAAGLQVICAADVFVHHFGQASFSKLIDTGDYDPLFSRNRALYEAKWNTTWTPHVNQPLQYINRF